LNQERRNNGISGPRHFIADGPVWMSTQNSFDVGMAQVKRLRQSAERANYFRAFSSERISPLAECL
jgi:hypothetical protein